MIQAAGPPHRRSDTRNLRVENAHGAMLSEAFDRALSWRGCTPRALGR